MFISFYSAKSSSAETQKSPTKVRGPTNVKSAGRKPNIKPASHFTERRSYEHVPHVTQQHQVTKFFLRIEQN